MTERRRMLPTIGLAVVFAIGSAPVGAVLVVWGAAAQRQHGHLGARRHRRLRAHYTEVLADPACQANPGYDGQAETQLLTGAGQVLSGEQGTNQLGVRVSFPTVDEAFVRDNNATATSAGAATDQSTASAALPTTVHGDAPSATAITFTIAPTQTPPTTTTTTTLAPAPTPTLPPTTSTPPTTTVSPPRPPHHPPRPRRVRHRPLSQRPARRPTPTRSRRSR